MVKQIRFDGGGKRPARRASGNNPVQRTGGKKLQKVRAQVVMKALHAEKQRVQMQILSCVPKQK